MTEVEQQPPPQNGIDLSAAEEDDSSKARPADIEQDMREMERRKRVEAIMGSKLFREELERIVDSARDGGGILQQLSDIMGVPTSTRVGNVFKATNCMLPINDIRGVESMGYAKGEKILRCKLAATFRLLDLYGWTQGLGAQITARLKVDQENFLVNPYGMMYHEITASSLNRVDMQGQVIEQGTTNFGVNKNHFALHSVVHAARPDIRCAIYIGCTPVVAVSSLKVGLLPLTRDACVLGEVTTHSYTGTQMDADERDRLVRALGPNSKVLILSNYGALCCGETIEEAFFAASHIVKACETQLQLLPVGVDNLVLIPEESRKAIYAEARRPPEDLEKKFAAAVATVEANAAEAAATTAEAGGAAVAAKSTAGAPKWRVGGAEFEALMRMLDNAGYRTGYIYRHPLIKSDPPKPKNDVELPPAVSSLGYLLEEEELLKQGIWKKGDLRKGGDRSRWLNSPNVYQKVEVLETGTPDPKKITKWVAEGSPTHSTPVRIEDPLQFVPAGTNPKEFRRLQQQIKDNRRADKISAGPQSHILEGVTWDEANRIKDATVSSAGDHVVLMGAASKGIIQRGYQHNAAVYKAPYAKNPFDNVTDDELNEYKRTVERKKKSIHGEYTDTDFSESEPLSSMPISAPPQTKQITIATAAVSQSEPEDVSEHQVMRIETQQAPVPSQAEVVLSDAVENADNFIEEEGYSKSKFAPYEKFVEIANTCKNLALNSNHQISNINSNRNNNNNQFEDLNAFNMNIATAESNAQHIYQANKENIFCGISNNNNSISNSNIKRNPALIAELKKDTLFQRQKHKLQPQDYEMLDCTSRQVQHSSHTPNKSSVNEKRLGGRVGDSGGEAVATHGQEFLGGDIQQRMHMESVGFRPIQPVEPRPNAADTITQQPHFCYIGPNNNSNNNGVAAGCAHTQHPHHHCAAHQHQRHQHAAPTVGIVTLPNFEQTFGHLLGRPTTDVCAVYYANYASVYEQVYEKAHYHADAAKTVSVVTTTTDTDEAENPYKKSHACCTPAVCDSIFESLRRPAANDNNLIFNIPFTVESPDTTSTSANTPRKTRFDTPQKQAACDCKQVQTQTLTSPYRTLSHFGFNSPQRDPQPDHKHIPCAKEQKKYVPLRKSISYEEIFSSPRYVDLCEYCFEKIVRLKPEVAQQTQMRLRNLCDYNGTGGGVTGRVPGGTCPGIMYQSGSDGMAYDYVEYASSDTTEETLPPFSSQLEPVLEVVEEVEPDSNEDAHGTMKALPPPTHTQRLNRTSSNSSFIEKIMRLNYSEESADWSYAHTPHKVASSTNLTLELERAIMEDSQKQQQQQHMSKDCTPALETKHNNTERESEVDKDNVENAMTPYVNVEESSEPQDSNTGDRRRISVTEIWEFMQWPDEADTTQGDATEQCFDSGTAHQNPNKGAICLYYENARERMMHDNASNEHADPITDGTPHNNDAHNASGTTSDNSDNQERRRSLMTREERSRRKLVFQELWEDHIFFLDGKELNSLSDTESAIDGQQQERGMASARTIEDATANDDVDNSNIEAEKVDATAPTDKESTKYDVVMALPQDTPKLVEAEVFNSRSVIMRNCPSGTVMRMAEDYEDLNKSTKSETLMKLQKTEIRRFSIHDLAHARKEYEATENQAALMLTTHTFGDKTQYVCEKQTDQNYYVKSLSPTTTETLPTPQTSSLTITAETVNDFKEAVSSEVTIVETEMYKTHFDKQALEKTKTKELKLVKVKPAKTSRTKRISPDLVRRGATQRASTPTPSLKKPKCRRLSAPQPETIIFETKLNMPKNVAVSCGMSIAGCDDKQSAHTYNVNTSQERWFFREDQLDEIAADAAAGRMYREIGEAATTIIEKNVEEKQVMHSKVPCNKNNHNEGVVELEVAKILINELKAPIMERAKAGMALPTDDQKTKSDHNTNTGTRNIPNVTRVARLTAEALQEASSKVYTAPRTTKRPRRKTNVLCKTSSNEASTSIQAAAQRTATELKSLYEPKFEEYALFKQNIHSPTSPTLSAERNADADAEDHVRLFDKDDMEFGELLESDEHEDLTKLNEEYEELLLNVENLQLQTQKHPRQRGGEADYANNDVDDDDLDESESHFNAMERTILRKIKENQLKESDEIFDKIETAIRNKMTPAQIEQLVKEQSLNMTEPEADKTQSSHSTFTASTSDSRFLSARTTLGESGGDSIVREVALEDTASSILERISASNAEEVIAYRRQASSVGESSLRTHTSSLNLRRSRSLTPSTGNCELSPPPPKLNKTTTPPQEERRASSARASTIVASGGCKPKTGARTSSRWPRVCSSTPELKSTKRNFILENIRNASIPRHANSGSSSSEARGSCVKRLQGNAQAIFCKNPFGPLSAKSNSGKVLFTSVSNSSLTSSTASSSRTVVKSSSQTSKELSPRNSSTGVYTFQSKLVRGSPRFWVSLTQPSVKKLQAQRRRRRSQHRTFRVEPNDSTGSLREHTELRDNEEDESWEEEHKLVACEAAEIATNKVDAQQDTTVDAAHGVMSVAVGTCTQEVIDDGSESAVAGACGVRHELDALDEQIQQLQPRLDNYKRKMRDLGDHVAKCTRHMDDCIAVQGDIVEERRQLREQMTLQQYAEHVMCQVHTYSISETED
ncbi:uncharacterized protein LOC105217992 isoform X1 [Zeugodacus cucurbitae]|uniref:uncharacterized protein LOC105217992 isoform X1 n=1 Tax=Zeugodacus cucurbitae TaxID=28588 RepID=UPI0023D8EA13|nr:uncharacterized protein LOC105217992 isoform X1 [Zeugodacus cucurbitae]XP_028899734.2 uncharacterized protein LOC105217992 isoform X1 [Zeugodacus cucurbitae]XP_028899735.2 uncharacterized protein LOC105217992 isoform X1 [Zeugodacus cucurbitae]XP_028899736.2 uncharacterized protein LOC105217992 isoform X1 [Zeugodacus cucurbitae]XP_054089507.1 uncharacterized protein LOC105217992 isoform X1 [Zeugodacus cucurbitae]XP_054089508.1 uncharacterized protein LOC105217992 isoform X1 [Zeugodacus cucur